MPWLSFGRIRTIHLNAVAYGWAPMAGLAIALFLLPRLLKTALVGARWAVLGAAVWRCGADCRHRQHWRGDFRWHGVARDSWQVDILFVIGGAFVGVPLVLTLVNRKVDHLYVSVWYMGCRAVLVPGAVPGGQPAGRALRRGAGHHEPGGSAITCWACSTRRSALASIYYFLPKIIGQPVKSYGLSLLGFWALAFFYGQVGGHHLVGGPVPGWLITLSIVQSMMMLIPVIAFSINQHQTLRGNFRRLIDSPTLRFVTFGGMMYTL